MIADLNHVGVIPVDLFLVEVIPYSWQNGVDPSPDSIIVEIIPVNPNLCRANSCRTYSCRPACAILCRTNSCRSKSCRTHSC